MDEPATNQTETSPRLIGAIIGSQFAPPFMFSGVAVSLPEMGADLGATAAELGLVETLFLAGSGSFLLPWGRLADATDRAALYKAGVLAFCATSFLIGVSAAVPGILFLRFLQGAASSAYAATGPAILTDLVPPSRRGRVFGASVGSIYAGLTLGPVAAGALTAWIGWRAVFLVGGGVLLVAFVVVGRALPSRWRRPARGAVHLPSAVLLGGAMVSLVFGTANLRDGSGMGFVALGAVLGLGFVALQLRLPQPLLDLRAIGRHPVLRDALVVQILIYTNAFTSIFLLSLFLQVNLGRPPDVAGQVLASGTLLMAILAPIGGQLADRTSARSIALFGAACLVASSSLGTTLDESTSIATVFLLLAIQGVGFALFASPNMTVIMNSAPGDQLTITSSVAAITRQLGMTTGMLIASLLISLRLGDGRLADHPAELLDVLTTTFAVVAAASVVALAIGVRAARRRPLPRPTPEASG